MNSVFDEFLDSVLRKLFAQLTGLLPWNVYASFPRRAVLSQSKLTVGSVPNPSIAAPVHACPLLGGHFIRTKLFRRLGLSRIKGMENRRRTSSQVLGLKYGCLTISNHAQPGM